MAAVVVSPGIRRAHCPDHVFGLALHDDIGSSLSQIAILSELARKKLAPSGTGALDQIADVSRELVDSMSDIVWATDPNRDRVGDFAERMREFAGEVLGGSDIEFRLALTAIDANQKLNANLRRQVYLIFKECIHNVIRHSAATEACVRLETTGGYLMLEVTDNGKGFDVARRSNGHGVDSLRERAASLAGDIKWISGPGGTTVRLSVPLHA
jgi:signal transduction histidine kinase